MTNFLRFLLAQLSFFFLNKSVNKKFESKVFQKINILCKKNKYSNNFQLNTHVLFNNSLKKIILQKKLTNFLRENFIQNIFFVHNRFYILMMLLKIFFNKNKLFKKLLIEDDVGNPVRYFLYPISSGNRIREVFHLLNFSNFIKIPLNKITYVFEFGGGYGNMARLFYKINKNINYTIFDTFFVNLLQYYYLKMLKIKTFFNNNSKKNINLHHKLSKTNYYKKNYKNKLFIANWSLSEAPIKLRKIILKKIYYFNYILISYQSSFEKINNDKFFTDLVQDLKNKKFNIKKTEIPYMNFFRFSNKHYYLFLKKNS